MPDECIFYNTSTTAKNELTYRLAYMDLNHRAIDCKDIYDFSLFRGQTTCNDTGLVYFFLFMVDPISGKETYAVNEFPSSDVARGSDYPTNFITSAKQYLEVYQPCVFKPAVYNAANSLFASSSWMWARTCVATCLIALSLSAVFRA